MKKLISAGTFALLACLATSAARAQDIQERVIKFGHMAAPEHSSAAGVRKFAELVTAKSGGKIKVRDFPSSQLGTELQQQGALQGGTQEMFLPTTTTVASAVKELGLFDFPFSVTNYRQAEALMDGPLGTQLRAKLPEKGLVALSYWENGFRVMTNSRRPVAKLEDIDGLKMRVIGNPVFVDTFNTLKANAVPMPFGEVYGGLESKAIDGQENPYPVLLANKLYEVQKYVSNTQHAYTAYIVLVSKKFWDKLSPVEQKILQDAANEAQTYQRAENRRQVAAALGDLKAKGMQFTDVPATELKRMAAAVQPVKEKYAAAYDQGLVKLYFSELDRIQTLKD